MRNFTSLRILEQGMEIMSTAQHLSSEYVQTDVAGLIDEINLLAIQIPSSVAASSKADFPMEYEQGLMRALTSVKDIEGKLTGVSFTQPASHPLNRLMELVNKEHELIEYALGHTSIRKQNRPLKRSRLSLVADQTRMPMTNIKVSQGVQVELF